MLRLKSNFITIPQSSDSTPCLSLHHDGYLTLRTQTYKHADSHYHFLNTPLMLNKNKLFQTDLIVLVDRGRPDRVAAAPSRLRRLAPVAALGGSRPGS